MPVAARIRNSASLRTMGNSKKKALRRMVLEAAAKLFARHGFAGTNLQDIANSLGISRPALYYYFKSKEDILASLLQEVTVYSGRQAAELASKADFNPSQTLREMTFNHAKWLLEHSVEFRLADRTENDLSPAMRRTHDKAKRAVLNNFTRTIERGIELGHFRPVDAKVAAFSIIGMCSWTAWWFLPEGRVPLNEVVNSIADFAVAGLRHGENALPSEFAAEVVLRRVKDDLDQLERLIGQSNKPRRHGRRI
jgi:AcrR family transcriptional regulator